MPVTAQQKLTNAYNEFIRDYVEAHGQNQATRDEAHGRAGVLVNAAQDAVEMTRKYKTHGGSEAAEAIAMNATNADAEEAYLVACAVAVALEEVK